MNVGDDRGRRFEEASRFIIKLGRVAHGDGVSSYRLESYLTRASQALGPRSAFMVTPAEGLDAIDGIAEQPPIYGLLTVGLGYALSGAGFAVPFFAGLSLVVAR